MKGVRQATAQDRSRRSRVAKQTRGSSSRQIGQLATAPTLTMTPASQGAAPVHGRQTVARVARRWLRLIVGLGVFAIGLALMVRADLGLSSWDVLHDALRLISPLSFGEAVIGLSIVVVLGSIALGIRPGAGTIANVVLVGAFTDAWLSTGLGAQLGSSDIVIRLAGLSAGITAIAFGTALYIGANLGAGPRDSLMLAVAKRWAISPGAARTGIELSVLVIGVALDGAAGIGTVAFALLIGPAINLSFRYLGMEPPRRAASHPGKRIVTWLWGWAQRGQLGASPSTEESRRTGGRI